MTKSGLLLYIAAVWLYCRYLPGLTGNDLPVYLLACACSLYALRGQRLLSKAFLVHFLFIQGTTTWLCHFFLAPEYQLVTARLVYVRGMLLGVFLVLELLAAVHLIRRYRAARRRSGSFACDAFAHALSPLPMLPELYKLFYVEFNIWRALLVRTGLLRDRDGAGMPPIAQIDTGYRPALVGAGMAALLAVAASSLWLPFPWSLAPLLAALYLALLLNCEAVQFGRHAVYVDGERLRIPNGIHGFVTIARSQIVDVSFAAPAGAADLTVARLLPANLCLRLAEPAEVFGKPVRTLALRVTRMPDVALLAPGLAAAAPGAASACAS